ncbi:uncharacterized protein METZ01_LOCUS87649 [marine metagenome]|uniref:Uncharacterized protein n=1 Tax=marine metagenome TaxID=408172 RepID=A0A381V357_9ZZZZ|tara:strand:- start:135 stop:284 length:150 start_codon:yes stop_codon:yes gene_type:complete
MELKNMGLIRVDRTMMQYLKLQKEKREKEKLEKEKVDMTRPFWNNSWRK